MTEHDRFVIVLKYGDIPDAPASIRNTLDNIVVSVDLWGKRKDYFAQAGLRGFNRYASDKFGIHWEWSTPSGILLDALVDWENSE